MSNYDHKKIEQKWQKFWCENKTFKTDSYSDKPKFYALDMFPYPSGSGLHVGHPEGYTATDILSRMKRIQGFEVLHPMGWDAFGLPAEQFALKNNKHPGDFTKKNIQTFKNQIMSLGFSYDWDREIATTDEKYYKWTQWIFSRLYEKGLAQLKNLPVNYCPECKSVLANEEVIDGKCERGSHDVVKKDMKQWELKITDYAERLIEDLDELDWPKSLKDMQKNWIGKSEGANVSFKVENKDLHLEVYTTRVDTIYGVSALFIAVEHELLNELVIDSQKDEVDKLISEVATKSELERTELNKDKKGVFTGSYATNPINGEKIEIWIADFVIKSYGTGIVMSTPAHDERDFEFATKYGIKITKVIESDVESGAYTKDGAHINSELINGLNISESKEVIIKHLEKNNQGKKTVQYKLRDWLFSRQRYWGEPFPILHLEDGSIVLEENLPVKLPEISDFKPSADGSSPLSKADEWLNTTYKGKKAVRETNTMPQWAGSCWYYIRYIDPHNEECIADKELLKKWLPVDLYIGGAEHAVLHLLYARFWHKVLYDLDIVDTKEPFQKLFNQGMILGDNNEKMSKSKGNVINPDEIVNSHGADTLRLYEMFMGPLDASVSWNTNGLDGSRKFLDRVYRLFENSEIIDECSNLDMVYNQTIKKVTSDYEQLSFNTAISQLMIFVNEASKLKKMSTIQAVGFLTLLNPIAPHLTEEINSKFNKTMIAHESWPICDDSKLVSDEIMIIVQINGKLKAKLNISNNLSKDEQLKLAKEAVIALIEGKEIKKEIVIDKKLVNIVI